MICHYVTYVTSGALCKSHFAYIRNDLSLCHLVMTSLPILDVRGNTTILLFEDYKLLTLFINALAKLWPFEDSVINN